MKLHLHIQDPSGEVRRFSLGHEWPITLGRGPSATLALRDPTTPIGGFRLEGDTKAVWIKCLDPDSTLRIGDFQVKEGAVPFGVPLRSGETTLTLVQAREVQVQPEQPHGVKHWLTESDAGNQMLWLAKKAATTPLSIYLAGETGTGKEVLAHLTHAWSDRASGPFVPLHCGALPLSLIESELFGHVKGAFTGAHHHRAGALVQAHNGTLFLDEVGDLPMDIQVKLLRFLENGEIRPVGSDRSARADVRLLCATHLPLLELVNQGRFRRDLYFRIASVTVEIPSLRSRPEDVAMLAQTFAQDLKRAISPAAIARLLTHAWPGNVRELRHAIERASGLAGPFVEVLNESHFDFLFINPLSGLEGPELEGGLLSLAEMEKRMVLKALRLARGHRAKAAQLLGVARSTLFEMLKRHRIVGPRCADYRLAEILRNAA